MSSDSQVHISRSGSVYLNLTGRDVLPSAGSPRFSYSSSLNSTPISQQRNTPTLFSKRAKAYSLKLNAGPISLNRNRIGNPLDHTQSNPTTTYVASASAIKSKKIASRDANQAPSISSSLYKTAAHASEVASQLQQSLRDRGREQNKLHSSIQQYESRLALLQATSQRLEAEKDRKQSQVEVLQEKLQHSERLLSAEQNAKERAVASAAEAAAAHDKSLALMQEKIQEATSVADTLRGELHQERATLVQTQNNLHDAQQQIENSERKFTNQKHEVSRLQCEIDKLKANAAQRAAEDAIQARELSTRAEAAQAALIRDQLVDDLRFKDEVIMSLRNEKEKLESKVQNSRETELALEASKRALDNAINERLSVDVKLHALEEEKLELLKALETVRTILQATQEKLQHLQQRVDVCDEDVNVVQSKAQAAFEEIDKQVKARVAAQETSKTLREKMDLVQLELESTQQRLKIVDDQNAELQKALANATLDGNKSKEQLLLAQKNMIRSDKAAQEALAQVTIANDALREVELQNVTLSRARTEESTERQRAEAAAEDAKMKLSDALTICKTEGQRASAFSEETSKLQCLLKERDSQLAKVQSEREHLVERLANLETSCTKQNQKCEGLSAQLKIKYEELAAMTVRHRHEVGIRDEAVVKLRDEITNLKKALEEKITSKQILLEGIREAQAVQLDQLITPTRSSAKKKRWTRVHTSRTGSITINGV